MNCYNKDCCWRSNDTFNVYYCDCAFVCPNKDDGNTFSITDHTDYVPGDIKYEK